MNPVSIRYNTKHSNSIIATGGLITNLNFSVLKILFCLLIMSLQEATGQTEVRKMIVPNHDVHLHLKIKML